MKYDFKKIESKWQKIWEKKRAFAAKDFDKKPKFYGLVEFPYPSGDGLHIGHVRSYTAMDVIAWKRRMQGYNVLYPMGWDAFGLPTENYAIKTGVSPAVATKKNTENFKRQCKALGFSFDWDREIDTTDPNYYKWTQWIFLQLFKHGLAYKANVPINWCPSCKIGLANEEVVQKRQATSDKGQGTVNVCERCGTPVEKRNKEQWMLKITAYADKLLEGLKTLDFLPEIKTQQENWIGRSEGALIKFPLIGISGQEDQKHSVEVFTTRPDTIFGATFIAISPEIAKKWLDVGWQAKPEVRKYIEKALTKSADREEKEKTGIHAGINAINPANKEEIPVWVVNYVLGDVGTGAIMAVPAHDERDFEFAKKYKLPAVMVVCPHYPAKTCPVLDHAYEGEGHLVASGKFDGMKSEEARNKITKEFGISKVQYKLRDWVFSRQRYWGEPIPLIFCGKCAWVPVPEEDLPVELPKVKDYKPRDDGQSPLASVTKWVNVKCPRCKGQAKRETDVMPNWAGSSWYYISYLIAENLKSQAPISKQTQNSKFQNILTYWMPVDWYNGGMEHVTLHLLYSRFWNLFLYDIGVVPVKEPYKKRTAHGLILAEGGVKMSKSKGNVVNPDTLIKEFGADALRLYEIFIGPFDQAVAWDPHGIVGTSRFLERTVKLVYSHLDPERKMRPESASPETYRVPDSFKRLIHKTVKSVSEDIETMHFNTAVSALMILLNDAEKQAEKIDLPRYLFEVFFGLLAPFAPHIAAELWEQYAEYTKVKAPPIYEMPWPKWDQKLIEEDTFELVIQINGKVRDKIEVVKNLPQPEIEKIVLGRKKVKALLQSKSPRKIIFVKGRLMNLVF